MPTSFPRRGEIYFAELDPVKVHARLIALFEDQAGVGFADGHLRLLVADRGILADGQDAVGDRVAEACAHPSTTRSIH